jgi:hypothetical protein
MNKILNSVSSIFILGIFMLGLSNQVQAEIIFEDNFDTKPDWEPAQSTVANTAVAYYNGEPSIPDRWSNYRVDNTVYGANNSHNTLNISGEHHRGGGGKGLTVWHESGETSCGGATHECSDGILGVLLPSSYPDLWVRFYMQWDTTYAMTRTAGQDPQVKFFRVTHWDETAGISPFQMFHAGVQRPIVNAQIAAWNNGDANFSQMTAFRYENTYYPDQATPSHPRNRTDYFTADGNYSGTGSAFNAADNPGDGQWHEYVYHVQMNSAVGVADGVAETWVDGRLIYRDETFAWSDNGSNTAPRFNWNMIMFGGNASNEFDPVFANYSEQFYAFDDICVATTEADLVNCFSAAPDTHRADVDQSGTISTTDASLTLRNSLGLNMNMTNWQASSTTGDVNCDSNSNTTDASLILRSSLGLSMSGTGWCVE